MAFRIGGGRHPDKLGVRLLADGAIARTETGNHSPHMEWKTWDVRSLNGKEAVFEIFDDESGDDWVHITVDRIVLGNGPRPMNGEPALWMDYGPDYYATVTWSDVPENDGRRIAIGWMSNWEYAATIPTSPWRGAMTLPRELGLRKTPAGLRVVQKPVAEFSGLAAGKPRSFTGGSVDEARAWLAQQGTLPATLDITMKLSGLTPDASFGFIIGDEADGETEVGFGNGRLFVDRTKSGLTGFHPKFPARHEAPVRLKDETLTLRMILDHSSLEVFAADGEISMTQLILPKPGTRRITLRDVRSVGRVAAIGIQPLKGTSW